MKNGFTLDLSIPLNWLYPPRCIFCATRLAAHWWCEACARDLPRIASRCVRCGTPLSSDRICGQCQIQPPHFDLTIAPLEYDPPLTRLIHQFKYRAQLALTDPLAELFLDAARLTHPLPQALIPVPLHPARLRRRGYNQALELARAISKRIDVPAETEVVIRKNATASQTDLPLAQRHGNVRGVFSARKPLSYKRITLVDDVMTSGATVNELARVLRAAGAEWIEVWAICRA